MSEIALPWCRHTAPRTHGDGDAARGLRAIVRGFVESGASMFLIDRDDFVKQVVEDLRGEGFDVHVELADVTDEAQMVRAFAEIGEVWGNLDTGQQREDRHDQRPRATSVRDFQRVLQLRWWTFTQLEGGTAQRRRHHRTRTRAAARHRRGDPPPPPAGVGGGDRPIPNPPHNSARPGHQRMTPRPAAQPRTECRCPGRFPDQPGAAMTSRSRHRATQPGPRHTHTAAPPCAAAASPLTMASEYLVDNRSVPS